MTEKKESENEVREPRVEGAIEIKFGRETFRGNYLTDLAIDERRLNDALTQQPARYVFWARMAAMARVIHEKWKFAAERYESQTYSFHRAEREQRGERVTEKTLEATVRLDPRMKDLREKVLRARLQYDHLVSVQKAFEQRVHMLMSLSANLREEMDTTLALREKELAERRLKDRAGGSVKKL